MATLNAQSTLEQIQAAYDDNASYAEDASVPKAKSFITACRMLVRRVPKITGSPGGGHLAMSPDLIQKEMQAAIDWVQANDTGETSPTFRGSPRVRTVSFENFR